MSVRIYQLSKQVGMSNNELIALLKGRGYDIKSASSTVDNISSESLVEEFASRVKEKEGLAEEAAGEKTPAQKEPEKPSLPPGMFVKSKEEVDRERKERESSEHANPRIILPPEPEIIPPPRAAFSPPPPPVVLAQTSVSPPTAIPPAPPPSVLGLSPGGPQPASPPRASLTMESREPEERAGSEKEGEGGKDLKPIQLKPPIVVRDFAGHLGLKPFRLISELMELGIFASMNQQIEEEVAEKIALRHGFFLEIRHRGEGLPEEKKKEKKEPLEDDSSLLEPRPPVVCILGHVDHGKTTLLDNIRHANIVAGEAGGITQHIGAYQVEHKDRKITFIDTPGHAAFSQMRARGARTTDIVILMVAADDGFMPQTDEALGHAQTAGVPIIVAINKIDTKGADVEKVKSQMQERNIASEDWGGETLTVLISALKGENIEELLNSILLQAEILENLKANPKCPAEGVVLETQKEIGRGATASVIIQKGTLKIGDALVCGPHYCRVRAMVDENGKAVKKALPSTPVVVTGWSGSPESGSLFKVVKNEREAKSEAEENESILKRAGRDLIPAEKESTLDDLFAAIEETKKKVFRVVIKADVYGTAEALAASLESIKSDKVVLEVVQTAVGPISKKDVLMASASEASIVGFNVNLESGVSSDAKHHNISIHLHNVIYELIDIVKEALADTLEPELRENKIGAADIRQIFPIGKGASVAGCLVTEGRIVRDKMARLIRNGVVETESKVETLKRFKEDAVEVRAGYECGIRLGDFDAYEIGDTIECFEIQKIRGSL